MRSVSAELAGRVHGEASENLQAQLLGRVTVPAAADVMEPEGLAQAQPISLSLGDRAMAAGAAAVLSAVIMNPLDVAKTRLQAQAAGVNYSQGATSAPCAQSATAWPGPVIRRHMSPLQPEWPQTPGAIVHSHPGPWSAIVRGHWTPAAAAASPAAACEYIPSSTKVYRGPIDVFSKVIREEGALRLWRGTSAGLLMAVPTVGIYMPIYEALLAELEGPPGSGPRPWTAPYAPFVAGSVSRSVACVLCSPLELARTRMQAAGAAAVQSSARGGGAGAGEAGIVSTLRAAVEHETHILQKTRTAGGNAPAWAPYRVLWRGVDAQLARDVPFSAICWSLLEPIRHVLLNAELPGSAPEPGAWGEGERKPSVARVLGANFTAALLSGSFAAAITTPLDVAKTRVQIEITGDGSRKGVWQHMREIFREGGMRALFTGVGPRSLRAGPSVGIIVSFYEVIKIALGENHRGA